MNTRKGYEALTIETLPVRLGAIVETQQCVGGDLADWNVQEVGDGNRNLVFIVEGTAGKLIVKQALPYVHMCATTEIMPNSMFEP